MKNIFTVLSVSLGSSKRDFCERIEVFDHLFHINRIGCDGNINMAEEIINKYDGKVGAITLGGIDIYLFVEEKRYTIPMGLELAQCAKMTPVVDGSGIKNTYERIVIENIIGDNIIPDLKYKNVLIVSAVDRFGMTQELNKYVDNIVYGDLIFSDIINYPIRNYWLFKLIANTYLKFVMPRLDFKTLYPTGKKQEEITGKHSSIMVESDVIVGDWHMIRCNLPESLKNKCIITNTLTSTDIEILKKRKLYKLITYTPNIGGRFPGTNVLEGMFVCMLKENYSEIKVSDYYKIIRNYKDILRPYVQILTPLTTS